MITATIRRFGVLMVHALGSLLFFVAPVSASKLATIIKMSSTQSTYNPTTCHWYDGRVATVENAADLRSYLLSILGTTADQQRWRTGLPGTITRRRERSQVSYREERGLRSALYVHVECLGQDETERGETGRDETKEV